MADNKRSMVQVFSGAARWMRLLGLLDASRRDSPGALLRPFGLAIDGNEITVIDRRRGMLSFEFDPEYFIVRSEDL